MNKDDAKNFVNNAISLYKENSVNIKLNAAGITFAILNELRSHNFYVLCPISGRPLESVFVDSDGIVNYKTL